MPIPSYNPMGWLPGAQLGAQLREQDLAERERRRRLGLDTATLAERIRSAVAGEGIQRAELGERTAARVNPLGAERQAWAGLGLQGGELALRRAREEREARQAGRGLDIQQFGAESGAALRAAELGQRAREFGGELGVKQQQLGLQRGQLGLAGRTEERERTQGERRLGLEQRAQDLAQQRFATEEARLGRALSVEEKRIIWDQELKRADLDLQREIQRGQLGIQGARLGLEEQQTAEQLRQGAFGRGFSSRQQAELERAARISEALQGRRVGVEERRFGLDVEETRARRQLDFAKFQEDTRRFGLTYALDQRKTEADIGLRGRALSLEENKFAWEQVVNQADIDYRRGVLSLDDWKAKKNYALQAAQMNLDATKFAQNMISEREQAGMRLDLDAARLAQQRQLGSRGAEEFEGEQAIKLARLRLDQQRYAAEAAARERSLQEGVRQFGARQQESAADRIQRALLGETPQAREARELRMAEQRRGAGLPEAAYRMQMQGHDAQVAQLNAIIRAGTTRTTNPLTFTSTTVYTPAAEAAMRQLEALGVPQMPTGFSATGSLSPGESAKLTEMERVINSGRYSGDMLEEAKRALGEYRQMYTTGRY